MADNTRKNEILADFVGVTEGIPLWVELDRTKHSDLVDIIYQMADAIVDLEKELEQANN